MEKTNTKIHVATALVLGSLAGVGLALTFAPQSGKKTREDMLYWGKLMKIRSEKAQLKLERGMKSFIADLSEQLQNAVAEGKEFTDKTVPALLGALETGKERIKAEIEKVVHPRVA